MACVQPLADKRPLKRPRLGPPDFYPQDLKQSEDDLTPDKLRNGYHYKPPLTNEYESAKTPRVEEKLDEYATKVVQSYHSIVAKKNEINALQDAAKKKAAMREPFWHCAARPKMHDVWFRDLAGSKPLTSLAKKFPFFNRKEDIFCTLEEFNIPICRSIWFIKMTNAYFTQQQETGKIKKKQTVMDPCLEWTNNLTMFLRQVFAKLTDYYSLTSQSVLTADGTTALKQWQYCTKLARFMFDEGLLDKQEFLTWMLEVFAEKCRAASDEGSLKLILPLVMQHLDGVLHSELLSRKLAYLCCKKLYHFYDTGSSSPGPPSPSGQTTSSWFSEYLNCSYHKNVIYSLSALVQSILVECPTSLVWNNMETNSGNTESSRAFLCGSPLDILPCFPSSLPIPQGPATEIIVEELKRYESEVKRRSIAVDSHWSFDKCEQSGLGNMVSFILATLEALDKHCYDKSIENNTVDSLYAKIFPSDSKELEEGGETTLVKLLCHWATTAHRLGSHRALVVVRLLEKRQNEIQQQLASECDGEIKPSSHYFQNTLFDFLDTEAPIFTVDDLSSSTTNKMNRVQFANLVLLFGEFIRADLFSHDLYFRMLISRGDLTANSYQLTVPQSAVAVNAQTSVNAFASTSASVNEPKKFEEHDFNDGKESEDSKIDIDKLLATIDRPNTSDYQGRLDKQPLSVGSSYPSSVDPQFPPSVDSQAHVPTMLSMTSKGPVNMSRHYYNVLHFPVPQDDEFKHECNQRQTLLFGCGSVRDLQKSNLRKIVKELNKLWHKKNSVECLIGGQFKIKRRINFEVYKTLAQKLRVLVYFDQYLIADACADVCLDQIREFTSGQSNYLPNVENLDFFLSIYESSLNISGLVEFVEALIGLLLKIENQLKEKSSSSASTYVLNVAVCVVGYLTKHLSYLVFSNSELINIWKLLYNFMKDRNYSSTNPSAERCVFGFLNDVYTNCAYLRTDCEQMYKDIEKRAKMCICGCIDDSLKAKYTWDPKIGAQYLNESKKEIDQNLLNLLKDDSNRYNFMANSMLALINSYRNTDRVFELARLCADVTAQCSIMSTEWLKIFKSLCCSKVAIKPDIEMAEFFAKIDINEPSVQYPLTALVVALVGRRCMRLEDFIFFSALHNLFPYFAPFNRGMPSPIIGPEAESTVRLVLHWCAVFCLCLETSEETICYPMPCRLKGELYLVVSALSSMPTEAVLTVLITILVFGNRVDEVLSANGGDSNQFHPFFKHSAQLFANKLRSRSLGSYASDILNNICQQEWVKNKFMQPIPDLFSEGLLLHPLPKHSQAQKMLHMIKRSSAECDLVRSLEQCASKKDLTSSILQNLTVWNLHFSLLDLELLLKQAAPQDSSNLADLIAKAAIDVFQAGENSFLTNSPKKINQRNHNQFKLSDIKSGWLVAPLVSKLPATVQGKVLKTAATVLESGQLSRKEKNSLQQSSSLLAQQPFLSLVLTCLRGQDDQRETLLSSLLKQLQEYVVQAKADKFQMYNCQNWAENREALQLRLSLVGGMFDTVCAGSSIENWAVLLLQLLLYGVITIDFDLQLFYTCVDMLSILIHSCLITDITTSSGSDRPNEDVRRRLHTNVTKKLKKEIGDRFIPALKSVHQLLPIPRQYVEIIACEPYGSQPTKNLKGSTPTTGVPTLDVNTRKGLQVTGKEKLSPWELIEGYRVDNSGPKWSLFQAVKVDHQPDTVVNQLNRLVPHDHYHGMFKRPPLPGESRTDPYLEPLQVTYDEAKLNELEKNAMKDDAVTPMSHVGADFIDQVMSPISKKVKKVSGATRGGRKTSRPAANVYAGNMNVSAVRNPQNLGMGMTPGPSSMPMVYQPNQQHPMTPTLSSNSPYAQQQQPQWSQVPPTPQMVAGPSAAMAGFQQPRGYAPPMMQPQMTGGRGAISAVISARLRNRQPSGPQVMMHDGGHPGQRPYMPHLAQKVNDQQFPNPAVQQQMQIQLGQHRQQLLNENITDQQQRPQLHRHMTSANIEQHAESMQQPMQQIPQNYGAQQSYMGQNTQMPLMSRQQSFHGGANAAGFVNTAQNFNNQQQYFVGNATNPAAHMRMPVQQPEMMPSNQRYSQQVNNSQISYNVVPQQNFARNSGNFLMQQQQVPMNHQQNQQFQSAANQQHYQQQANQQQMYPVQRGPSYSNLPMDNSGQMNYYQQQQQQPPY